LTLVEFVFVCHGDEMWKLTRNVIDTAAVGHLLVSRSGGTA